ncbi:MAG: class I SAM-dependent methyltransferase [Bdellovibrionaceae bacterium]|nr:class I SAM-dependent methyltransferase [Pseudobdellovibrionaceae bacterium]
MRQNLENSVKLSYLANLTQETQEPSFKRIVEKARLDSIQIGKHNISLSEFEAQSLFQLIKMNYCNQFIELGSLTGYSGIFILSALVEGGTLYCFEKDLKWIPKLEENLKEATQLNENNSKSFEIIAGDALLNLKEILNSGQIVTDKKVLKFPKQFDGFFIDANKSAYLEYLNVAIDLLKPGGVIIADNIFLEGSVWGEETQKFSKKQIEVMRSFNQMICNRELFDSLILDTTDGMVFAKKR